jgi:dTDP-4-dehydrorhamnose reductase
MVEDYKQVLIVGGTGQVGLRLCEIFSEQNQNSYKILATSRKVENNKPCGALGSLVQNKIQDFKNIDWFELDLEWDKENFKKGLEKIFNFFNKNLPTLTILTASFTNVDGCEMDPAKCQLINESNTAALIFWLQKYFNSKIVFFSTDYVFDGEKGPYSEDDKTNPLNVYGRSKLNIENWIQRNLNSYLIIRTTGVFDYIEGSKNFLMQMLTLWSEGKKVKVVNDQFSNPIWAYDLALVTRKLLEKNLTGIYHVAGRTYLSRYEFAKLIASVFNFSGSLIEPISTSEANQKAKRPKLGGLKCDKVMKAIDWNQKELIEVLKFIKENFTNNKK